MVLHGIEANRLRGRCLLSVGFLTKLRDIFIRFSSSLGTVEDVHRTHDRSLSTPRSGELATAIPQVLSR